MKRISIIFLFLSIVVVLSGCVSSVDTSKTASSTPELATLIATPMPTTMPTVTATHLPSLRCIPPTSTTTQTPTLTLPPTLEPEQAEGAIRNLLQQPLDCPAPCFLGIVPGQTTLSEARDIFTQFGLEMESTTFEGTDFHGIRLDFDSGFSISVILTIQDQIVENLRIKINPEKPQAGVPREWLAYSPETLINRYGTPSGVDFWVGRTTGPDAYSMVLYFDDVDLIVQYAGSERHPIYEGENLLFRICPLTDEMRSVGVWLGEDPQYPPGRAVPIQDATDLNLTEFAKLMIGDPDNACIELKDDAFPK